MTAVTRSRSTRSTHWYVRLMDRVGGLDLIRQLDEGEQRTALESGTVGHMLASYSTYLAAIAMAWLGDGSALLWSALLFMVPAISQTLGGMYGWVKRRQMGVTRLSTRTQMLSGIPILVLSMMWLAGFLVRATGGSVGFKIGVAVFTLALMVVLGFVFIRAGQQEQERADRAVEDDDEF